MNTIIFYLLSLIAGGIAITGWFAITRGRWKILPDGNKKWVGKIFCNWQKFWEKEITTKPCYYSGDELEKLLMDIEKYVDIRRFSVEKNYRIADGRKCIYFPTPTTEAYFKDNFYILKHNLNIRYVYKEAKENGGVSFVFFYKAMPVYRFPEWIRDPIASCIYCHSSVYGTLIWGLLNYTCKFLTVSEAMVLWIPYCISLTFVSPYLWKKL